MDFTLIHSSRSNAVTAHIGFCATESAYARYGRNRYTVSIPAGLEIRAIASDRARIDANDWPGDTAEECAEYAAQGIDVISYEDMDEGGRQHTTWRLVSERAVATVSITLITDDEE